MRYIILNGFCDGTGVKDRYTGACLEPDELNVSDGLKASIADWAVNYYKSLFEGSSDEQDIIFHALDNEGIELSRQILRETKEYKIDYYYSYFLAKEIYFQFL